MRLNWQNIWSDLETALNSGSNVLDQSFLDRCVLSASGLRFIHSGDEQDLSQLPHRDAILFALCVLEGFAKRLKQESSTPEVWLGMDARPTGPCFFLLAMRFFNAKGFKVRLMGHGPIPEVMAATHQNGVDGFCYFTASHNPAGHNGFKLGLRDGAVLNREESLFLIQDIRSQYETKADLGDVINAWTKSPFDIEACLQQLATDKKVAQDSYLKFAFKTIGVADGDAWTKAISESWEEQPFFMLDMNGSSRLESIDLALLEKCGLKVIMINDELGSFAHAIVPEGDSLIPLKELMQQKLDEGCTILGGMVPDCDGDRGNLILPIEGKATALKAQETFALCALAEFSSAAELGKPLACAVNGPSSLRLEKLLEPYQVEVVRAEVGEANVLAMAQLLKTKGFHVPISGEGSNGGNILDGATVRDPLMTLLSLLKFSQAKGGNDLTASEKCLQAANLDFREDMSPWEKGFSLLPKWQTTDAFEGDALMPVPQIEHEVLKSRYEELLIQHFDKEEAFWSEIGVAKLCFFSNEGTQNIPGPGGRPAPGKGGLQVFLLNEAGQKLGFLWMRGSGTEPVFRVVVDWNGSEEHYAKLLSFHRDLIDKSAS